MVDGTRSVLITGGASGIGNSIADLFAQAGDAVTVLDRRASENPAIASVVGDVRSYADNERAVRAAAPDGSLDVLVANAGIHDGGMGLVDTEPADLEARFRVVFEVDVLGYLLVARAAADALCRARGCIVLTLSDASFDVAGNGAGIAYVAAKHAGLGLLRALARDLAPDVRVNAVAPGGVHTNLAALGADGTEHPVVTSGNRLAHSVAGRALLGHGAGLADLAETYAYLCSPSAAAVTGQVLRVDGGLLS